MNLHEWKKWLNDNDYPTSERPNFRTIESVLEDWEADRVRLLNEIQSLNEDVNHLFNETVMLSNHN